MRAQIEDLVRYFDPRNKKYSRLLGLGKVFYVDTKGQRPVQVEWVLAGRKVVYRWMAHTYLHVVHQCEKCKCDEIMGCLGGCAWNPVYLAQGRYICTRCEGAGIFEEEEL